MRINYFENVPEHLNGIPSILYKYRAWEEPGEVQYQRRIITNNELFLSSPQKFNDPFDCSTPFRYKKEQLTPDNIYLKLREIAEWTNPDVDLSLLEELTYNQQKEVDLQDEGYYKDFHPKFLEMVQKNFGVFCSTPHPNNILMWSHYADSHKGFCVGLDSVKLFKAIGGIVGAVRSVEEFIEVDMFDEKGLIVSDLLYAKHKIWEYEDEYRYTKIGKANKVIPIPDEAIKQIIFGCNMTWEIRIAIIKEIKDLKGLDVQFFEAKASFNKYELEINEMKLF